MPRIRKKNLGNLQVEALAAPVPSIARWLGRHRATVALCHEQELYLKHPSKQFLLNLFIFNGFSAPNAYIESISCGIGPNNPSL
jgi:hypothetical protein